MPEPAYTGPNPSVLETSRTCHVTSPANWRHISEASQGAVPPVWVPAAAGTRPAAENGGDLAPRFRHQEPEVAEESEGLSS